MTDVVQIFGKRDHHDYKDPHDKRQDALHGCICMIHIETIHILTAQFYVKFDGHDISSSI